MTNYQLSSVVEEIIETHDGRYVNDHWVKVSRAITFDKNEVIDLMVEHMFKEFRNKKQDG